MVGNKSAAKYAYKNDQVQDLTGKKSHYNISMELKENLIKKVHKNKMSFWHQMENIKKHKLFRRTNSKFWVCKISN